MREHIRRGLFAEEDVDVPGSLSDSDAVLKEYVCQDCDTAVRLRARMGEASYVRLGCDCGALELGLRIARQVDDEIDQWEGESVEVEQYD